MIVGAGAAVRPETDRDTSAPLEAEVVLDDETKVRVSRSYASDIRDRLV